MKTSLHPWQTRLTTAFIALLSISVLSNMVALNTRIPYFNSLTVARADTPGKDGPGPTGTGDIVVNEYASLSVDAGSGATSISITPDNSHGFGLNLNTLEAGDLLLIIQTQGATIDTSDSPSYGTVTSLNNAGRYEFVTVNSVSGNTVGINGSGECLDGQVGLRNSYTAANRVQVVRVPQYSEWTINGKITAPAWNVAPSVTGGIVAAKVAGTVTLNGTIDVGALGFRGGDIDNSTSGVGATLITTYRSTDPSDGAEKGESIAGYQTEYANGRFGRGAPANGGGGGNGHNAGGGGGANASNGNIWNGQGVMVTDANNPLAAWQLDPGYIDNGNALTNSAGGGRGGYSFSQSNQDATLVAPGNSAWRGDRRDPVGGLGGRGLDHDPTTDNSNIRLFFGGGGGGAGDGNNNKSARGGHGGGLVYLLANTISGSGSIEANGEDGFSTPANGNDAPGGAGGGGTVVITANSLSGISVNADGGEGGNQNISNREAEGPGGGGGGGYIAIAGGSIATSAQGGANGTTNSPALTEFPANGATAGANGVSNAAAPLDGVNLPSCAAVISTDYGDAPVSYDDTAGGGTIDASDNPAEHAIASTLYLGSTVPDDETAPQSSVAASADDNAGTDDEDGINIFPTLNAGSTSYALDVTVNNTTTNPANVYGWIDFDLDGEFDGDERAASATVAANSTNATVTLNWPSIGGAGADISAGDSYLRLRVATEDLDVTSETTGRDDASVGSASNGEVEDYQVAIAAAAPPTPPTGPTCVSPSTTPFNTVPYTLNTEIQNSLPLSFYNGSMTFDATLNGTATFAGTDGIQVQTDGSFDDHIFVQPTNLPNYLAGTNNATYVFSFPTAVEDFSMVAGGLNNSDGTTISAEFQGSPVPIDATNFSNLSAGMTLRDADGDGASETVVSTSTSGGFAVTSNTYSFNIAGPIDKLTVVTGKEDSAVGTVTLGFLGISFCGVATSSTDLILLKRVTAINAQSTNPNDGTNLDVFVEDGIANNEDNDPDWPTDKDTFLDGAIAAGNVGIGDEVEFTIYFLSTGGREAQNVVLCDVIPDNMDFVPDSFATNQGIGLALNSSALPSTPNILLTNTIGDGDRGDFYNPGSTPPSLCIKADPSNPSSTISVDGTNNLAGAVVVTLTDPIPAATTSGTPPNSYGFIRFRAVVRE